MPTAANLYEFSPNIWTTVVNENIHKYTFSYTECLKMLLQFEIYVKGNLATVLAYTVKCLVCQQWSVTYEGADVYILSAGRTEA